MLQTMIRRNMDRNQGNNQHRKISDATQSARADSNGLQTMIRRKMDRNRPTIGLFAGQIPCYKRYTIADHLYGR